jgi:HEPN domain-containing protein
MPPDPVRVADTRAWLEKAEQDLRSAKADLAVEPPILGDAVFHCQQAVEKTLKAFLTWHDRPFRKTHDLGELGGSCVALDVELEPLLRQAAPLTEYAWKFRYPGDLSFPTAAECEAALTLALQVVRTISDRLPPEARITA